MKSLETVLPRIEAALRNSSAEYRNHAYAKVSEFIATNAANITPNDIKSADALLLRFMTEIEAATLAKVACYFADVENAPRQFVKQMAAHEDILVAGPILAASPLLDDIDLVEIATSRGPQHHLAMIERKTLGEPLTLTLLAVGNSAVVHSLAAHAGAKFCGRGFDILIDRSREDEELAFTVGTRADIPRGHLNKLVERASAAVRKKLVAANPKIAAVISEAANLSTAELRTALREDRPNFLAAKAVVEDLFRQGRLDESAIVDFAARRKFDETLIAVALRCRMDVEMVEQLIERSDIDALVVLTKLANISRSTASAVIVTLSGGNLGFADLEAALSKFVKMRRETAQSILAFKIKAQQAATAGSMDLEAAIAPETEDDQPPPQ